MPKHRKLRTVTDRENERSKATSKTRRRTIGARSWLTDALEKQSRT